MLDPQTFKTVVACQGKLLLGLRNNEPLKGKWFTPGGRIAKNERWQDGLKRIAMSELGIKIAAEDCQLMGVWDHFYRNSAVSAEVSTHYVNLPHLCFFNTPPELKPDQQHSTLEWHDLPAVSIDSNYHSYMNLYAEWVLTYMKNQRN